jgi:hypothetical protein
VLAEVVTALRSGKHLLLYWIEVKTTWRLTVDEAEKQAIARMLDTCRRPR